MAGDSTLLPNRAGEQVRRENRCQRLRRAAVDVSRTWHNWMESNDDAGMEPFVDAMRELRTALDSSDGHQ